MVTKTQSDKESLYELGVEHVKNFCRLNDLPTVRFTSVLRFDRLANVPACGWYRKNSIHIKIWDCAGRGRGGMAWSWPGYVIDRTPYGVLAHEIGHHCDYVKSVAKGSYGGDFSVIVRNQSAEPKLTNYCPNDSEWFAEMMRLFITNPDLLRNVRPRTYRVLLGTFQPCETRSWEDVLEGAPLRTILQARKKFTTTPSGAHLA